MIGYVETSMIFGDARAFGWNGSCAVCFVAGGSSEFGPFEGISEDDTEAAIFAVCQRAKPGDRAIDTVASSDRIRVRVRALGGKLGVCFRGDRKLGV